VKTATVLQSIFNRAVIEGLAERNPVAVVRKPPQRRKREPDLVSPETVERIRANLREPDAMLVSLLAYAGLRPESEAVTLTWGQVGRRSLRIDASKTGRQRHVRLLAPLAEDLEVWRTALGSPAEGTLVCPRRAGAAWDQSAWRNWVRRIYRPAAIKAGLDTSTRPRDLRGSFASLLIWEGQTVVEVAQQLGHSAEMCLRSYAGVFAEFSIDERGPAGPIGLFYRPFLESPAPDSNRRPLPYHGSALPTELAGRERVDCSAPEDARWPWWPSFAVSARDSAVPGLGRPRARLVKNGDYAAGTSVGVTVVTGRPVPDTLLGRSSFSQRDSRAGRVERMISSKPRRLTASCTAVFGSGAPTIASTGPPAASLSRGTA
jgi:hypothetical protein